MCVRSPSRRGLRPWHGYNNIVNNRFGKAFDRELLRRDGMQQVVLIIIIIRDRIDLFLPSRQKCLLFLLCSSLASQQQSLPRRTDMRFLPREVTLDDRDGAPLGWPFACAVEKPAMVRWL